MRQTFIEHYACIRACEGRGSDDGAYYRALPFADLTGRHARQWQIRARTFRYFVRHVLPPAPCRILDLGAGNGWLSYRLRELGHEPVAVDIFRDRRDGLAAVRSYPAPFPAVEADFDCLPFADGWFDLAVFNASIHYSPDYERTLTAVRRCLRPGGRLVILDSPVYKQYEDGVRMRTERQAQFQHQYGFRSEALGSIEFLDERSLAELARRLALQWEIYRPWYGWRWHLRPVVAWIARRRPPSRFWILSARFSQ